VWPDREMGGGRTTCHVFDIINCFVGFIFYITNIEKKITPANNIYGSLYEKVHLKYREALLTDDTAVIMVVDAVPHLICQLFYLVPYNIVTDMNNIL
jgi:hypothetical protein